MKTKRTLKKPILIVVLLLAALLTLTLWGNALDAYAKGDVDGDTKVTSGDARLALRASVGLEKYAPGSKEYAAADVDGKDGVTSADARLILRASVGLEDLSKLIQRQTGLFSLPIQFISGTLYTVVRDLIDLLGFGIVFCSLDRSLPSDYTGGNRCTDKK